MLPCPCGSGKKYKHCCIDKDFEWTTDEQGQVYKSVPIDDELMEILIKQREKFVKKYGREPGPEDRIFFDMPDPEEVTRLSIEAMQEAGIDPALIYAYRKTGLVPTKENKSLMSESDLAEWDAAIDEYERGTLIIDIDLQCE